MLTVTEPAGARLAQMLAERGLPEEVAARLVRKGRRITLRRDSERPGDATFRHEGRTVLVLDARVSGMLAKHTLDVEGTRLRLQHPKKTGQPRQ